MAATMGTVLDRHRGLAPGFDFARVFLAFSVIGYHCVSVIHGDFDAFWQTPGWFINYAILPMFFGLSGFLIAGSAMRLSLKDFLINRGLRIIPALAVEVILSAVILGGIFTSLPKQAYYTDPGFLHYFTNIFGWINFYLPGVFKNQPLTAVNNSLWTIPWEILCYGLMSGLIITSLIKRNPTYIALVAVILLVSIGFFQLIAFNNPSHSQLVLRSLIVVLTHRGSFLLVTFLLGIVLYLVRHRVPYSPTLVCYGVRYVFARGAFSA